MEYFLFGHGHAHGYGFISGTDLFRARILFGEQLDLSKKKAAESFFGS